MKIQSARLKASARTFEECPATRLPEFAFIGRSNVGKSSLINALTRQKELAHTSGKPGKTQQINLFVVNDAWTLVDLPGYGYARLSKERQGEFNLAVSAYLTQRENLKQVFLLVDSRIEPQGGDLSFAKWLEDCEVPYSIVFTKTDRATETEITGHQEQFTEELERWNLHPSERFSTSAKTRKGCGRILQWIEQKIPSKPRKKGSPINLNWMK